MIINTFTRRKNVTTGTAVVQRGRYIAYFTISSPLKSRGRLCVISVVGSAGKPLKQKIVFGADLAYTKQQFGIIFNTPKDRLTFKTSGDVKLVSVRLVPTGLPTNLCIPLLGNAKRKEWGVYRRPPITESVWIDPKYGKVLDYNGVPLYRRVEEHLWNVGRICGLAFRHAPYATASWRYHFGTPSEVMYYCRQWNSVEWFGTAGLASSYIAVHPNKRDIWTGGETKDGGVLGYINAVRFPQAGYVIALGWPYHDDYAPIWAARNANRSGPITYSGSQGLAGYDSIEINWFRQYYGMSWLSRAL